MNFVSPESILINTLFVILFTTGCNDSPSGPPESNGENGGGIEEPITPGPSCKNSFSDTNIQLIKKYAFEVRRDSERLQHKLNERFSEFGGMYLNESQNLVVSLTGLSKENQFYSIMSDAFASKMIASGDEILFQKADFSFRELAAWRELATAFLLSGHQFHYVLSTQVHEVANRVAIGIDQNYWTEENLNKVTDFMTQTLEIPGEALLFEPEYPETEEQFTSLQGDTFDRQRPIVGGLRIRYGSSNCTIGFLGVYEGEDVFVTNGHCTDNAHGISYTLYNQGERDAISDVVGTEIADGPQSFEMCVTPNSDCWPCRWSDSAIISIREDVSKARGYIAKPTWKSENWMIEGSREIDEQDPVFTIVDLETEILSGMQLQKVGGNSGWTSGEVIRTCVDSRRSSHELILQCQFRAKYATSGGGTSGSPVFRKIDSDNYDVDNPVALVGIHRSSSNRDQPNGYSGFSPINGVLQDFEELAGLTIEYQHPENP